MIVTFLAFLPALGGEFINFDDDLNFLTNPNFRGLGIEQLRWMWTAFHQGHYHPITWMTLGLDYTIWGMDPRGYHLTNLILHTINAGLFFILARRIIALGLRDRAMPGISISLAAMIATVFFSIHPLRVESVAWITERRDLVSGALILCTVIAYLRFVDAQPQTRAVWYGLTLLLLVLSLLSKVIGVTVPIVLLVLDWYPLRRFSSWRDHAFRQCALEKIPMLAIGAGFGAAAAHFDQQRGWVMSLAEHALPGRIGQVFYGLAFYVWKMLVPANLLPLYEMRRPIDPLKWPYLLAAIVVLCSAIVLVLMRRRVRGLVAAAMAYAVLLGPTLGIVQTGPQLVADRYSYLSCMGWAIVAGAMVALVPMSRMRFVLGSAGLIAAVLFVATWQQCKVWHDTFTFWEYMCRKNAPSAFAWNSYGGLLFKKGRIDEADRAIRRSLEIDSRHASAHYNLGNVLLEARHDNQTALKEYRTAAQLDPKMYEPHYNAAMILMQQQDFAGAEQAFGTSLQLHPENARGHANRGICLVRLQRFEEAINEFNTALQQDSTLTALHLELARVFARLQKLDEARRELAIALRINPNDPAAQQLQQALNQASEPSSR